MPNTAPARSTAIDDGLPTARPVTTVLEPLVLFDRLDEALRVPIQLNVPIHGRSEDR